MSVTNPEADTRAGAPRVRGSFRRPFLLLFALGMVGVLALYPALGPTAEMVAAQPGAPEMRLPLLQALLLVNPTILLLIAVAVGTLLAPRLGLRSYLAESARGARGGLPALRSELPWAIALGAVAALLILVLDVAFRPWLPEEFLARAAEQPRTLALTLAGMLYGGVTEELIVRWGLLSLLAGSLWRLVQRGEGRPAGWIMWSAIVVAAVVFGAGHLGAVAAMAPLTGALITRTIVLNTLGGVVFGWLFWRKSLEAAMIAHATGHVVFTLAAVAGTLLQST